MNLILRREIDCGGVRLLIAQKLSSFAHETLRLRLGILQLNEVFAERMNRNGLASLFRTVQDEVDRSSLVTRATMKILMIGFAGFIMTRRYRRDQSSLVTILKYQKTV